MRPHTSALSPLVTAYRLGIFALPFFALGTTSAQTTGFNQTGGGPFDYTNTANWVGGTVNGIWDSSLTLSANQTMTFTSDTTLSHGLSFSHGGGRSVTVRATDGARTLTLNGGITAIGGDVIIGSTNSSDALALNLGGATRTFAVNGQGTGSDFGKTLNILNSISNGSLIITSAGPNNERTNGGSVRLGNTSNTLDAISVQGAQLHINGTDNGTDLTTTTLTGALNSGAGHGIVLLTANAGQNTLLQADSFTRSSGSSVLFRGVGLGTNTIASATAGSSNIAFTNAPVLLGGTGLNTTDLGIIAGAFGDSTNDGKGSGLVTYDASTGVRLLTSGEYKNSITDGQSQLDNVLLLGTSGALATTTLNSATTINSLSFDTSVANSLLTLDGTGTLTLNSGVIFARQTAGTSTASVQTINNTLDFNAQEAIITTVSSLSNEGNEAALTIRGAITNATGFTKNGTGALNLLGDATNTYTGTTTVNAGALRIGRTVANTAITDDLVVNGGVVHWARANQISDTGTITIRNTGLVQLSDRNFGSAFSETFKDLIMTGGRFRTGSTGFAATTTMTNATLTGGAFEHNARSTVNITGTLSLANGATYAVARANSTASTHDTVLTLDGGLAITQTASGAYTPITLDAGTSATNFGGRINLNSDVTFTGNGTNTNTTTISALAGTTRGVIALGGVRTFDIGNGAASSDLTIDAALIDGSITGGLTKTGLGTLALTTVNTYTGATHVNQGTLLLGTANALSASSPLSMNGGTLNTGGFSQTLGTVALTANSIIDLGTGNVALLFAASNDVTWTDSVTLSFVNVNAGDTIQFGSSNTALTSTQLAQITINGFTAMIDSSGLLTASAIPEPSSYALFAGISLLIFTGMRRRARPAHRV